MIAKFLAFFSTVFPALVKIISESQRNANSKADKQSGYDNAEIEAQRERDELDRDRRNADIDGVRDNDVFTSPIKTKRASKKDN